MSFGGLILTNKGRNLQAKAQAGAQLNFTRIAIGDGELGGTSILDINALVHEVKSLSITKFRVMPGGKAVCGSSFSNQDLVSGFYWRELGLYATDPDLGEILYCYGNAGSNAEYIPAGGGPDVVEKHVDIVSIVGNAANVTATIEQSLVFATIPEVEALVSDHEGKEDPHLGYIKKSLATTVNDFLVASGPGVWVKKTLAEVKAILGLGSAAYTSSTDYAAAGHNHDGVYSASNHNHSGVYAIVSHNHDSTYIPKSLATSTNDFVVASGAGSWVKKTLSEVRVLLDCLLKSGGTMSGEINCADNLLTRPKIKDYSEVVATDTTGTGTQTISFTSANVHNITQTGNITFSLTNPPANGDGGSVTIRIKNGATVYSKTFPSSVKWAGDEVPDMSEPNKVYDVVLATLDGGTVYHGACIGPYSA